PGVDNVANLGTSSLRFKNFTLSGQISWFAASTVPGILNNEWGIDFPTTSIDFYRNVAASHTLSTRFGSVGQTSVLGWDFGANAIGFGNGGVGGDVAFIIGANSGTVGELQINTNNAGTAAGPNASIIGSIGTGNNHGGGSVIEKAGYGTGTAKNGIWGAATAPSTAGSGSTANNSYITNLFIASQPVTLTESSATLVLNITVPSGKVIGGTLNATTEADDASNFQSVTDLLMFQAVNKGGTVTATINTVTNNVP